MEVCLTDQGACCSISIILAGWLLSPVRVHSAAALQQHLQPKNDMQCIAAGLDTAKPVAVDSWTTSSHLLHVFDLHAGSGCRWHCGSDGRDCARGEQSTAACLCVAAHLGRGVAACTESHSSTAGHAPASAWHVQVQPGSSSGSRQVDRPMRGHDSTPSACA